MSDVGIHAMKLSMYDVMHESMHAGIFPVGICFSLESMVQCSWRCRSDIRSFAVFFLENTHIALAQICFDAYTDVAVMHQVVSRLACSHYTRTIQISTFFCK